MCFTPEGPYKQMTGPGSAAPISVAEIRYVPELLTGWMERGEVVSCVGGIAGIKMDAVDGQFRLLGLHNELRGLNRLVGIFRILDSKRLILAGHIASMWETKNAYNIFMGKALRKFRKMRK
jgi:hypothetical protein